VTRKRAYRSYLLRCWECEEPYPTGALVERFVVESVTDDAQHQVFVSFDELVIFLRHELLGERQSSTPQPGHETARGDQ